VVLRVPPLLRELDFRRFWAGQTISLFGDQITLLALPLAAVLELHAHAAEMGLLTAAALAPHLLLSLGAGAWLDRRPRRRPFMIAADLCRAGLLATVPLADALGGLTMAQLYAIAFATGVCSVFFDVSYPTVFVSTIPRDKLLDANGLLSQSRAFAYVGGPSLAGALVQLLKAPITLLIDAASFLGSAFFLARLGAPEPPLEHEEPAPLRTRLLVGLRFILASPTYRASLLSTATLNFFNFMFFALFVLFATQELNVRPGTLGVVLGVGALGGVIGAFLAAPLGRRIGVGPAFLLGSFLFPAPLVLVPLARGPHGLVLAMLFTAEFLSAVGVMVLDINGNSINVAITPDRLRARVTGAHRFVNYGVRPLGSLAGGLVGAWIGLRPTLWLATVAAIAGVLWLLPSPIPRLRELPAEPGEGVPAGIDRVDA
jgi:MFS family permease